jgi:hypothetical protein
MPREESQNETAKAGPDAPVTLRSQDHLQRWRVARKIHELIRTSPLHWSLRIGVYGHWGEGKTTVLRFIETMAREDGYPVAWFNPWSIKDRNSMWKELSAAVDLALGRSKVTEARLKKAGEKLIEVLDVAAEVHWAGKALKSLAGSTLEEAVAIDRADVEQALTETLGELRLLIMIDDVDRADPEILPYILLALRELLDLPQSAFVLALDPDVVSEALGSVHRGWRDGLAFLEKIVDFPFWLPQPTQKDLRSLVQAELRDYGSFVDQSALYEIAELLPTNPRRLKQFLRMLWPLRPVIMRHDPDELSWIGILICNLLCMENEGLVRNLATSEPLLREISIGPFRHGQKDAERYEQEFSSELSHLWDRLGITDDRKRQRIRRLLEAWRDRSSLLTTEQICYHLQLLEEPPIITWKEIRALFERWKHDPTVEHIQRLIAQHAAEMDVLASTVQADLFETLLMFREQMLQYASDTTSEKDLLHHLDEAKAALALLRILAIDLGGFTGEPPWLDSSAFQRLFAMVEKWVHFQNHPRYRAMREAEEELLVTCVQNSRSLAVPLLEILQPWDSSETILNRGLLDPLIHRLAGPLQEIIADNLLERFERRDGIRSLAGQKHHIGEKYILFSPRSPLYADNRKERLTMLSQRARDDAAVHGNFVDFIRMLESGIQGNIYPPDPNDFLELAKDLTVIRFVWRAATTRRLQPRVLGSLKITRDTLICVAGTEEHLPLPQWWHDVFDANPTSEDPGEGSVEADSPSSES